jgi:Tfp pilus assembly ATPase PilU
MINNIKTLETMEVSHKYANLFHFNTCTMHYPQADYNISKLFAFQCMKLKASPTTDIQYHRIHTISRLLIVSVSSSIWRLSLKCKFSNKISV